MAKTATRPTPEEYDLKVLKAIKRLEGAKTPEGKEFSANEIGDEIRKRNKNWKPTDKALGQSHLRRLRNAGAITGKSKPRPIKYALTAKGRKFAG